MSNAEYTAKIAKLLALAESTTNPAEAQAFSEKAQALMLKWGVEESELLAAGKVQADEIVVVKRKFTTFGSLSFSFFDRDVVQGFGDIRFIARHREGHMNLIGHKTDIEYLCMLLNSLQLQAVSGFRQYKRTDHDYLKMTRQQQDLAFVEFMAAFSHRVMIRLMVMRSTLREDASPGAAIVLANRQSVVDVWIEDNLGKVRRNLRDWFDDTKNVFRRPVLTGLTAPGASDAGSVAGRKASLGGKSLASRRELER